MLLILAEANAFNTSGAYNGGGLRPPLPKWGRRPSAAGHIRRLYAYIHTCLYQDYGETKLEILELQLIFNHVQ